MSERDPVAVHTQAKQTQQAKPTPSSSVRIPVSGMCRAFHQLQDGGEEAVGAGAAAGEAGLTTPADGRVAPSCRRRRTPIRVPAQAVCSCSHPSAGEESAGSTLAPMARRVPLSILADPVGSRHRRYAAVCTRWRRWSWRLPACRQQVCRTTSRRAETTRTLNQPGA